MHCDHVHTSIAAGDWAKLRADLDPKGRSRILEGLLAAFRAAGARRLIEESAYIDRDFSSAYSSFYSTLYRQRPKYCRRLHFFASQLKRVVDAADEGEAAAMLEAASDDYLGYIVVRPLAHAPVSHAIVSSRHGLQPGVDISIRSIYQVHLLGAVLTVEGAPLTEQDTITGSCAQATLWVAGRHLHNRHGMGWFSVADITELAVKPIDSFLSKSLPIGSESLSDDNMVRALRAMGEHPVVYKPESEHGPWTMPPARTIAQYLDSGVPVIVGLRKGTGLGHAVVAVGSVVDPSATIGGEEPAPSDRITHFIVNDDQRGPYQRLAVQAPVTEPPSGHPHEDAEPPPPAEDEGDGDENSDFTLANAIFLIVPLPSKVFLTAETAEAIARDKVESIFKDRARILQMGKAPKGWNVDPEFYGTPAEDLPARTYLTMGWKHKQRMIRNAVAPEIKVEMNLTHLPRYVWVTEFSLPNDTCSLDPCQRRVRGHVLVDATGNRHDDRAVLMTHVPGILTGQRLAAGAAGEEDWVRVLPQDSPYFPKVRGWADFRACELPR